MDISQGLSKLGSSNSLAEQGTPDSGYEEHGPYHCEDCIHKTAPDQPYCIHPKVIKDRKLKEKVATIGGKTVVQINLERGCCRFVNQPLEEEGDEDELNETQSGYGEEQ